MYYSLFSHIDMFLKKQGIWKSNYIFILLYYIASYLGILRIVAKFLQHHDVYSSFFKNHLFLVKLKDFIFNFKAMIFVSPCYTHFFYNFLIHKILYPYDNILFSHRNLENIPVIKCICKKINKFKPIFAKFLHYKHHLCFLLLLLLFFPKKKLCFSYCFRRRHF